jgi:hypothetical protein
MKIARPVIYVNAAALILNALLLLLTLIKLFPVLIGLMLVIGCLGAAVWYSCYLHGKLPL